MLCKSGRRCPTTTLFLRLLFSARKTSSAFEEVPKVCRRNLDSDLMVQIYPFEYHSDELFIVDISISIHVCLCKHLLEHQGKNKFILSEMNYYYLKWPLIKQFKFIYGNPFLRIHRSSFLMNVLN